MHGESVLDTLPIASIVGAVVYSHNLSSTLGCTIQHSYVLSTFPSLHFSTDCFVLTIIDPVEVCGGAFLETLPTSLSHRLFDRGSVLSAAYHSRCLRCLGLWLWNHMYTYSSL